MVELCEVCIKICLYLHHNSSVKKSCFPTKVKLHGPDIALSMCAIYSLPFLDTTEEIVTNLSLSLSVSLLGTKKKVNLSVQDENG